MKIAVISDTHVPHLFEKLSQRMKDGLMGVDLILHCGDIVTPGILQEISSFAPVEAVAGNHDMEFFGDTLPRRKVIEARGFRIGMIHGDELAGNHVKKREQYDQIYEIIVEPFLKGEPVDCIVFGHTHQPLIQSISAIFKPEACPGKKIKQDILLFNPGTPVRNRRHSTMGYLYLENDALRAEIKVFTHPRSGE